MDPRLWSGNDVLRAALQLPQYNTIGDLIIGVQALELAQQKQHRRFDSEIGPRLAQYRQAVSNLSSNEIPSGMFAGGAHPKFGAEVSVDGHDGPARQMLVKFSPSRMDPLGIRWADLLLMEHHALEVIRTELLLPAASTTWLDDGDCAYLVVERFDRTASGRVGMISLAALDAEHLGLGEGWQAVVEGLVKAGMLAPSEIEKARTLIEFSVWIGNTDRHLGNLSVIGTPGKTAVLAPAYDVLPMEYAPMGGATTCSTLSKSAISASRVQGLSVGCSAAIEFWSRLALDLRLSEEMRALAAANRRWISDQVKKAAQK